MPTPLIALPPLPGITALFAARPNYGPPMRLLAQSVLCSASPLSWGERELIGAFTSRKNDCIFCYMSHAHIAAILLKQPFDVVTEMISAKPLNLLTPRLIALLDVAEAVAKHHSEKVMESVVHQAKRYANEDEIHDTVLVASAFCMFNRWVDSLRTELPHSQQEFRTMAERIAERGYI